MRGDRNGDLKLLAVASGGGHWDELMLLRSALEPFNVTYVTTNPLLPVRDGLAEVGILPDCNRDQYFGSLRCLVASFRMIRRRRPDVVLTTGALPGLFCVVLARLFGAKTVWVDSIANWDQPSLSGRMARPFTTMWLTQWSHLADDRRKLYRGALL